MVLTVGTGCSGMEAPIEALRLIGCAYEHVFSSEIDPNAILTIKANHAPRIMYGDITKQDVYTMPAVDLYIAGFPCQAYSTMNTRVVSHGCDERKTPLEHVIAYIRTHTPVMFVLENVLAFTRSPEFRDLVSASGAHNTSVVAGMPQYRVSWACMTPQDHGSPQSRRRVFIVGRRDGRDVVFPHPVPLRATALDILDESVTAQMADVPPLSDCFKGYMRAWNIDSNHKGIIDFNTAGRRADLRGRALTPAQIKVVVRSDVAPCILASGAGLYAVHLQRHLTIDEHMRLQGFRHTRLPHSLAYRTCLHLIGNSMNVPTLAALLKCNLSGTPMFKYRSPDAWFAARWKVPVQTDATPAARHRPTWGPANFRAPPGWRVEVRVRAGSGGVVDAYYHAPDGTRYRSIAHVLRDHPQLRSALTR